jgi:hypothetical protein
MTKSAPAASADSVAEGDAPRRVLIARECCIDGVALTFKPGGT